MEPGREGVRGRVPDKKEAHSAGFLGAQGEGAKGEGGPLGTTSREWCEMGAERAGRTPPKPCLLHLDGSHRVDQLPA